MRTLDLARLFILFVAILVAGSARAADATPGDRVKQATEKIQALIQQHRAEYQRDKAAFYATVDEVVTPAFDVPYLAQITLGRAWRNATEAQRARFQNAFKRTLIQAYADALLENSEFAKVEWARVSTDGDTANLHATVLRSSGPPVAMGFGVRKTDAGDWRAYDISVEGVSLITNFRSQFASEVKRDGLDALIQRLEAGS
jgi:phospholipid transport system substrate-binding protein